MPERIRMLDGDAPGDWRRGIEQSRLFVALITSHYLRDATCLAQAAYAKQLGKPFRLLVLPGTQVPEDFLDGVRDLQMAVWVSAAQSAEHIAAWLNEMKEP